MWEFRYGWFDTYPSEALLNETWGAEGWQMVFMHPTPEDSYPWRVLFQRLKRNPTGY